MLAVGAARAGLKSTPPPSPPRRSRPRRRPGAPACRVTCTSSAVSTAAGGAGPGRRRLPGGGEAWRRILRPPADAGPAQHPTCAQGRHGHGPAQAAPWAGGEDGQRVEVRTSTATPARAQTAREPSVSEIISLARRVGRSLERPSPPPPPLLFAGSGRRRLGRAPETRGCRLGPLASGPVRSVGRHGPLLEGSNPFLLLYTPRALSSTCSPTGPSAFGRASPSSGLLRPWLRGHSLGDCLMFLFPTIGV